MDAGPICGGPLLSPSATGGADTPEPPAQGRPQHAALARGSPTSDGFQVLSPIQAARENTGCFLTPGKLRRRTALSSAPAVRADQAAAGQHSPSGQPAQARGQSSAAGSCHPLPPRRDGQRGPGFPPRHDHVELRRGGPNAAPIPGARSGSRCQGQPRRERVARVTQGQTPASNEHRELLEELRREQSTGAKGIFNLQCKSLAWIYGRLIAKKPILFK